MENEKYYIAVNAGDRYPLLKTPQDYAEYFNEALSFGDLFDVFRYIENRRLANAKKLLERGESVQAAAEKSGFPDYSHFISLFKRRFGITPKKFQSKFSR